MDVAFGFSEEVLMFPRFFSESGLRRCTFKYGLDRDFRSVLNTLEALGLDKSESEYKRKTDLRGLKTGLAQTES